MTRKHAQRGRLVVSGPLGCPNSHSPLTFLSCSPSAPRGTPSNRSQAGVREDDGRISREFTVADVDRDQRLSEEEYQQLAAALKIDGVQYDLAYDGAKGATHAVKCVEANVNILSLCECPHTPRVASAREGRRDACAREGRRDACAQTSRMFWHHTSHSVTRPSIHPAAARQTVTRSPTASVEMPSGSSAPLVASSPGRVSAPSSSRSHRRTSPPREVVGMRWEVAPHTPPWAVRMMGTRAKTFSIWRCACTIRSVPIATTYGGFARGSLGTATSTVGHSFSSRAGWHGVHNRSVRDVNAEMVSY